MHMSLCESEETSIDILCSIQEKAILIGQEIERENTQISCETVRNLEEYCECIYKMSLKSTITPDDIRNADELIKDISQLVEKFITDKVRVAFFHIRHLCGIVWKVFGKLLNKMKIVKPRLYRFHSMKGMTEKTKLLSVMREIYFLTVLILHIIVNII